MVIPLPPLSEQRRIVEKLESLMPLIESYGKSQEALDALNASLPEKLRQSILQEAIQGHLVPQDPNEEPASVLLERIRAEKVRLVKIPSFLRTHTSINHFHTGTTGIPSSVPSSSYVISKHFQSSCALAYFTSGVTSLL